MKNNSLLQDIKLNIENCSEMEFTYNNKVYRIDYNSNYILVYENIPNSIEYFFKDYDDLIKNCYIDKKRLKDILEDLESLDCI